MSLEREASYGAIKINDNIFARIILDAVALTDGKVLCSTEKGKYPGGFDQRVSVGELLPHIRINETDEEYVLEFYIIMSFGASIKDNCVLMLDYIEEQMKAMFPDKKGRILLKITGVKSKKIAPRDIKIVRKYEP